MTIELCTDPFPGNDQMNGLWAEAWGEHTPRDFSGVLSHSLGHVGAYDEGQLIGFVNVALDGGIHALSSIRACILVGAVGALRPGW